MKKLKNLDEATSYVLSLSSGALKIAAPLGLGKPNQLLNQIYNHFKHSSNSGSLEIYTALSLDPPTLKTDLERKLLQPFFDRHFGVDYPRLHYVQDLIQNKIPSNIKVHEFYFLAGQFVKTPRAQQNYISLNYTHAARGLAERGLQVIVQLIAKSLDPNAERPYSLSCNPDMTLDLVDLYREKNKRIYVIGVVHPDLPYLEGDACVEADFFEAVLESDEVRHQLFALPRNPVDAVDHMIGMHASQLVADGGTLQIGIGSLSDALVHAMIQRQQNNVVFKQAVENFWSERKFLSGVELHTGSFNEGLYGTSEMLMDGFMHLRKAQILKRIIFDQDEQTRRYLHAAFFLGSKNLYSWLRTLKDEDFNGLSMTRVSKVNDLYDPHEMALRRQRKKARFFNTCMEVNLLGSACSDTLPTGQVVSGVGGQFNFVAMSQELSDSHSILMLRSTRIQRGQRISNIVGTTGQITIPRHLRDIVVTEYGIACLRGKSDSEVISALIEISDSQFQPALVRWAKKNNKLGDDYVVPSWARQNTPQSIQQFVKKFNEKKLFPETPFGLDFDEIEFRIVRALSGLKQKSTAGLIEIFILGLRTGTKKYLDEIKRLQLDSVASLKNWFERQLVLGALEAKNRDVI